jgi:hypothetical protein
MFLAIYNSNYKSKWDNFVNKCKNTHFFFQREYMDYHNDRFNDYLILLS